MNRRDLVVGVGIRRIEHNWVGATGIGTLQKLVAKIEVGIFETPLLSPLLSPLFGGRGNGFTGQAFAGRDESGDTADGRGSKQNQKRKGSMHAPSGKVAVNSVGARLPVAVRSVPNPSPRVVLGQH